MHWWISSTQGENTELEFEVLCKRGIRIMKTAYHALNRFSRVLSLAAEWLGGIMIALCFFALFFQVLYRFVLVKLFSFSFPFTEEFARYALAWSCYLCIGVCLREGSQASVNFLYDRLSGLPKALLFLLTRALMWVFLAVALYYGCQLVMNNLNFRSATMQLPGIFIFTAPLAGIILMALETVIECVGVISGELEPFTGRSTDLEQPTVDEAEFAKVVDLSDLTTDPE